MKKTLLLTLLLAATGVSAQTVSTFYNVSPNTYTYKLIEPFTFDESPEGENAVWDFPEMVEAGDSSTAALAATTAVSNEFPNTNTVIETTGDFATTQFFLNNTSGGGSYVTAASANGILLDYSVDNAYLGTFPKTYGSGFTSDAIMGSFTYGTFQGTFTGTCTTVVDGYGTLSVNVGTTPAGTPVTRLKIEQDIYLTVSGVTIGTAFQVMYSYYAAAPVDAPVFRTITVQVDFPLLFINDIQQSVESYYNPAAATPQVSANKIAIAPNPVAGVMHFTGDAQITNVTVTDAAGRQVLQAAKANDIDVSQLSTGVYYVAVQTPEGVTTQKIVKL